MANSDIRRLIESLPEDKKEALVKALEGNTGITADALTQAANDPQTAQKLNKLASQIDPAALKQLAGDSTKLNALLSSPQVKNALKGLVK